LKRLTPFEFIAKAIAVHGNKYDYSQIMHVYASEKVTIICKTHNYEFQQSPSKHLSGFGCNLCSGKKKKTTNEFIQDAKKVHGERYNYDKTEYSDSDSKLTITCNKHGDFFQNAGSHLQGKGCPKCSGTQKLTTIDFINRAKEIHHNKYNYDKVNYINSQTKVSIGCQIHGYFEQIPKTHLEGSGCTKCSRSSPKKLSSEEFIEKAKKVHGNEYDYDNVIYVHSKSKVNITCRSHGDFKQVPGQTH